jgi:transcriptional regulator with XRE-family HTH domain
MEDPMPTLIRPHNQPNRNKEIIGAYIKEKRLAAGLTQQDVVDRMGKDFWFTALSAVERGERNLPPHLWRDIAEVLGLNKASFGKLLLRYTHPWAYGMIYGFDEELEADLAAIPEHYVENPGKSMSKTRRAGKPKRSGGAYRLI